MVQTKSIEIDLSHISEKLILFIDAKKNTDIENDENNQYNHEPQYQLKEGRYYDYSFSHSDFRLICRDQTNIVQARKRKSQEFV